MESQSTSASPSTQSSIAQIPSPLSMHVVPSFDIPLGDTAQWFNFGGSLDLRIGYRLPQSIFSVLGGMEYSFEPILASQSTSLIAAKLGAGAQLQLTKGIAVQARALAGYYVAAYNDFSLVTGNPWVGGGIEMEFSLSPSFALQLGAQYRYCLGLYQGISAGAGIQVAVGNLGGSVELPSLQLLPAFPVFYKHYDDHPIGEVEIRSRLRVPATDIRAQIYIKEYMDAPKTMLLRNSLAAGETMKADLYALFTDKVLGVTEGTKVAAEISISYVVDGQTYEDKQVATLTILGRNAMTWDDNRKAAAFVTSKEPQVLNFARSVTSFVRARENRAINDNLQAAMALHEALDLYGINYTPNPVTPYSEASKQKDVIDFLQFPRETFQYKAGDCSDLSILYSALLQAVGIDAAFITVPGHIYVAVNTGLAAEKAADALIPVGQFIAYDGKAWIPVEITMRHQGFMRAWQLGAKEWTENEQSGQAGFYPLKDAWAVYQPVGLPGEGPTINVPQSDGVLTAYLQEVQKYLDAALAPQVAKLQKQIQSTGSLSAMNGLGVLYAKYGQTDQAEQTFKGILEKKVYLPTLLNLGNLYFLKEDWTNALTYYSQADDIVPNNPHVLYALARANQELQDYAEAKKNYDKLKVADPALASQLAYLGEENPSGARAADVATERRAVIWEAE